MPWRDRTHGRDDDAIAAVGLQDFQSFVKRHHEFHR
jgi:hypothetical protein